MTRVSRLTRLLSRIRPSLWPAIALMALVFGGGAVSVGVQGWQARQQVRARAEDMTGGSVARGNAVIAQARCGSCHQIPDVDRATGTVGPPLKEIATRAFLAGRLANNPANMIRWVRHPQAIEPGNGMPDPPIGDQDARDMAAYLYTLR